MHCIQDVHALHVLDSRGNPTVEATVTLTDGSVGNAITASGASTGQYEAYELRDSEDARYRGKGVYTAVANVAHHLKPAIVGMMANDLGDLAKIDARMTGLDSDPTLRTIGANAVIAVSMATARAIAASTELPLYAFLGGFDAKKQVLLPVPMLNVVNGGKHAPEGLEIQELMIVPGGAPSFSEAIRAAVEVYGCLRDNIKAAKKPTTVGDEGGFAPGYPKVRAALNEIRQAIKVAGYAPGSDVGISIDAAATEFYRNGTYNLPSERTGFSSVGFARFWSDLVEEFSDVLISIEDGFADDDFEGWEAQQRFLGERIQLVGDDVFVTNRERLERGIAGDIANAILIKPNQNGTVTGTLETCERARNAGYGRVVSHRSGETEDTFIVDLAVGIRSGQIKTGAPCRTDRVAKYNELLRIEDRLGAQATYAGWSAFSHIPSLKKRFGQ